MELHCLDIDTDKDTDSVAYEVLEKDFGNTYHAAAWRAVNLGRKYVYVTHLAANTGCSQLGAALSNDLVVVHDWETLKQVTVLKGHSKTLTGVRYLPNNESVLISSALDGSIRQWDTRAGQTVLQYTDDSAGDLKPLTCCDVNASGRFICAGTELVQEDSFLVFWDVRKPKPLGGYWESHTDDISTVRFHPTDASALATGSTDGYVNVFDVSQTTEDDALQSTLNTESSVSAVTWYESGGSRHLAVTLHMEELQCWDLAESDQRAHFQRTDLASAMRRTMAEACYTAGCQRMDDGSALVLAGTESEKGAGCLRLLRLQGDKLVPHALLEDTEVSPQVVRASCYNSKTRCLVTGGEAGVLTLWRPGAGSLRTPQPPSHKAESHHRSGQKRKRKQPY